VDKAPDAFRTISEVADELDVPQHVLRFWETRFAQIKPMKRGGGRRYYRPDDLDLLRGIRHLLYGEGYTIRGVQRILKDNGIRFVQSVWQSGAPQPVPAHLDGDADDNETVNGADGVDEAEAIMPSAARTAIAPQRQAGLSPDDLQSLRAALAELAECRRLLDAAMKDDA
jgi:DNA-binding transcriptional MerR regulator